MSLSNSLKISSKSFKNLNNPSTTSDLGIWGAKVRQNGAPSELGIWGAKTRRNGNDLGVWGVKTRRSYSTAPSTDLGVWGARVRKSNVNSNNSVDLGIWGAKTRKNENPVDLGIWGAKTRKNGGGGNELGVWGVKTRRSYSTSPVSRLSTVQSEAPKIERIIPFSAPIVEVPKGIPGNVKLPMPWETEEHRVAIPYVPEKFDSAVLPTPAAEMGDLSFPRLKNPRIIHTASAGEVSIHHAGKSIESADSPDFVDPHADFVSATATGSLEKGKEVTEGVLSRVFNMNIDESVKAEEWKFQDRDLGEGEKKGLYVLGGLVAGGVLLGGFGEISKH